ncbi:MAG TPA: hypothetical protein VKZ18_13390 [Polyangia bacterium]|nr:hypothetical protein [Polyangia bacterium]
MTNQPKESPERSPGPARAGHRRRLGLGWLALVVLAAVVVPRTAASEEEQNRCGCYRDGAGACFCSKKATCGCPGDCEPRGCEEKRDKDLQREIQAETRKAEEAGRGRSAAPDTATAPPAPKPARAPQKLSPAQARQLGKLLQLYLNGHPGAGGKSVDDLRTDLSGDR